MKNDTKSIVRRFSDCRLDTYCGMLGAAADAEKNAFFLIAQPMKSSIKMLSLKLYGQQIKCPIIESIDHDFKPRIFGAYDLKEECLCFERIEAETAFLTEHAGEAVIVTDVIANYLNPALTEAQKKAPIGSISTVRITDYDTQQNLFRVGMLDVSSNRQVVISVSDYQQARRRPYLPFSPSPEIFLYSGSGAPEYSESLIRKSFDSQMRLLAEDDSLTLLRECVADFSAEAARFTLSSKKKQLQTELLRVKNDFLYSSMVLGSTSFFYYDLAEAADASGLIGAGEYDALMQIGAGYKRMIHRFGKEREDAPSAAASHLCEQLAALQELKDSVFEKVLPSQANGTTAQGV